MLNPEKAYHELMESGNDWADKDSAANLLEELKKVTLADITVMHLKDAGSVAKAEVMALSSERYAEHLGAMVAARKAANRARVRYDATKTLAELRRTEAATRRAEMALT